MSILNFDSDTLIDMMVDNVIEAYGHDKEGSEFVKDWMEKIRNLCHAMITYPIIAMEITESYPEDLKALGVEVGKTYNLASFSYVEVREILTAIYVLSIYSKAVDTENPEWEFEFDDENNFSLKENNVKTQTDGSVIQEGGTGQ